MRAGTKDSLQITDSGWAVTAPGYARGGDSFSCLEGGSEVSSYSYSLGFLTETQKQTSIRAEAPDSINQLKVCLCHIRGGALIGFALRDQVVNHIPNAYHVRIHLARHRTLLL